MCESHAAIIKLKFLRYCSLPVLTDKKSVPFDATAIRQIENQNNQTPIKKIRMRPMPVYASIRFETLTRPQLFIFYRLLEKIIKTKAAP